MKYATSVEFYVVAFFFRCYYICKNVWNMLLV